MARATIVPATTANVFRILCPVDFSDFSRRALEFATDLAHRRQAELVALHVFVPPLPPFEVWPTALPLFADVEPQLREQLLALLGPACARGVRVRVELRAGHPPWEIARVAQAMAADLVVMATHGRTGFDRWLLGSTTESVLRKAHCSVLTVSPAPSEPTTPAVASFAEVLCALDLSPASVKTLRNAASLACETHGRLTVLHVLEGLWDEALGTTLGHLDVPEYRRSVQVEARERLHAAVLAGVPKECEVVERVELGKAYRQVLRVAGERTTDLIVIGVHGANPIDTLVFGSTAQHVVRAATCPVLAVR